MIVLPPGGLNNMTGNFNTSRPLGRNLQTKQLFFWFPPELNSQPSRAEAGREGDVGKARILDCLLHKCSMSQVTAECRTQCKSNLHSSPVSSSAPASQCFQWVVRRKDSAQQLNQSDISHIILTRNWWRHLMAPNYQPGSFIMLQSALSRCFNITAVIFVISLPHQAEMAII